MGGREQQQAVGQPPQQLYHPLEPDARQRQRVFELLMGILVHYNLFFAIYLNGPPPGAQATFRPTATPTLSPIHKHPNPPNKKQESDPEPLLGAYRACRALCDGLRLEMLALQAKALQAEEGDGYHQGGGGGTCWSSH